MSSVAHAGTFAITKNADSVINSAGWVGVSGATYGRAINGNSFETSTITTYNGYQYTAFWSNVSGTGSLTVARRPVGGTWQSIVVPDKLAGTGVDNTIKNGPNDAHNVVSLGIDKVDGTIHLAYDMHGHTLRYRIGAQGIATNPASYAWTTANASVLFPNAERNWLTVSGSTVTTVTYPMFVNTPTNDLQFFYRNGASGNGSWLTYSYNGTTHAWDSGHQFDDGTVGTYYGTVTNGDTNRNNYPNGFTYDANGRLHSVFTWREGATGAANHDLMYVYSDDNGATWKNNAGTVVANQSTGQKFSLNSPGLIIRPLDESQTLMNQQGQGVDHQNQIHSIGWHRDSAKDPSTSTSTPWEPQESSYFHNWRDSLGNWHETRLPGNVGARPKIFFDANDNAVAIYQSVAGGGNLTGGTGSNLYFENGDLVLAMASKASNWTDWKIVKVESGNFISEAQADAELFASTGVLSVVMQTSPTLTTNAGTSLRTLDYSFTSTPATQRTLSTTGDWNTASNWSGSTVPGLNTVAVVNAGRTVTVDAASPALDNMVWIGSGGSSGTMNVAAGADLNLLQTGPYNSISGGSISVGHDSNSGGTYTQTGGTVQAWRFAVGDYATDTSGGGVSSATVSGGSLTTYELDVGFSANASSSGSTFTQSGGSVTVNGDVILGEFGNNATLNLTGGTMTVAGNVREGFNKTNVGTLLMNGGTLDMTGNSITLDVVTLNSGTILNLAKINGDAVFSKNSAGTISFGGNSTFASSINVITGNLRVISNTGLGSTAGATTISGGTLTGALELAGGISLAEPIVLAGRQPLAARPAHIVNVSGNNTITSPLNTTVGGNQYTLRVDGGTLTVAANFVNNQSGSAGDIRFLNLDGSATGMFSGVIADNSAATNPSKTSVVKFGTGTWTLSGTNTFTGAAQVNAGTLALNPAAWNVLTNAGGVDIAGGSLVFNFTGTSSPKTTVLPLLTTAYASGFTTGQLRSSIATSSIGLGWIEDTNTSTLTVRPALYGDANLDGVVNFTDLLSLAASYGNTGTAWANGDANYDGTVNFSDLLALASNYSLPIGGSFAADWAMAQALVPEPTSVAALGLISLALQRRR
ncbi:MAG: BNR-4 repeat-containing protein [Tepidisphaeraceae bacterium]